MAVKLTLSMEESVIDRAKHYARQRGVSVSKLVEGFLKIVSEPSQATRQAANDTPVLNSLRGCLKHGDREMYRAHIAGKYQ